MQIKVPFVIPKDRDISINIEVPFVIAPVRYIPVFIGFLCHIMNQRCYCKNTVCTYHNSIEFIMVIMLFSIVFLYTLLDMFLPGP